MGQRKRVALVERPEFKYPNLIECEIAEDHHVVKPTAWPPQRLGMAAGEPSVPLQCEHCGCWLVVYKGHATGDLKGIKVILPVEVPA